MKMLTAFVFVFSLCLFASDNVYGQGKGQSRPDSNRGRVERPEERRENTIERRIERREERREDRRDDRDDRRDDRREDRFEDRLERNTEMRTRLERLLPAGINLRTAASGFKNQGQFIAALHASQNLGIPFAQLKSRMTGPRPMSLGQAIHDLKPNMPEKDSHREAERAEKQAKETAKSKG